MQCLNSGGVHISRASPFSRWLLSRHYSCSKLFVGGLSYDTNETVLKNAFEQHGEIIEVKVICHHVSGKSKGYGFVHFTSEAAANTALKEMDGQKYSLALCTQGVTIRNSVYAFDMLFWANRRASGESKLHVSYLRETLQRRQITVCEVIK